MLEHLSIGQIINIHGFRGEVKVYPLTDDMNRFRKLKEVFVEANNQLIEYVVEEVKFQGNVLVMKLKGIDTEEAANKLRNCYIKVDRKSAVKLPKDTYFICDLIDLKVYDEEGLLLGTVGDVLQTGSNDVYVVKTAEKDLLIPALKEVVKEIDIRNGKLVVKLPEGLM